MEQIEHMSATTTTIDGVTWILDKNPTNIRVGDLVAETTINGDFSRLTEIETDADIHWNLQLRVIGESPKSINTIIDTLQGEQEAWRPLLIPKIYKLLAWKRIAAALIQMIPLIGLVWAIRNISNPERRENDIVDLGVIYFGLWTIVQSAALLQTLMWIYHLIRNTSYYG